MISSEGCEAGRSHFARISWFRRRFLWWASRRRSEFFLHDVYGWICNLVYRNVASGDRYVSTVVVGCQSFHTVRDLCNVIVTKTAISYRLERCHSNNKTSLAYRKRSAYKIHYLSDITYRKEGNKFSFSHHNY